MNDRKAFEKWLFNLPADFDASRFPGEHERWPMQYRDYPVQLAAESWQACAEHYEAVMRRVLVEIYDQNIEAYRGLGGPMACETYMDEVIKRAREGIDA